MERITLIQETKIILRFQYSGWKYVNRISSIKVSSTLMN